MNLQRILPILALMVISLALFNCGGGSKMTAAAPIPNIAGAWEFLATPSPNPNNCGPAGTDPCQTGVEVSLQEAQTLVNGVEEPNGVLSANGTQIAFVNLDGITQNASGFGGFCTPAAPPTNGLSGNVTAFNAPFNFVYTENGNAFNVVGTLSGDGTTLLNATYTAQSGSGCTESGAIAGSTVSKLSGEYVGVMCPPSATCTTDAQFSDAVTATLSESSSGTLTITMTLQGTNNTSLTLTGPVTGKAFSVQGTFGGENVSYSGYSELGYDSFTQNYDLASLFLVDMTNAAQPSYAGTLSVPQTPALRKASEK